MNSLRTHCFQQEHPLPSGSCPTWSMDDGSSSISEAVVKDIIINLSICEIFILHAGIFPNLKQGIYKTRDL